MGPKDRGMAVAHRGMAVAEINAMRLAEEQTARSEFLARLATISSKYNQIAVGVNPALSDHEFDSSAPHVEVLAAVAAGHTGFFAVLLTAFLRGLQTGVAPAARVLSDLKEYGLFSEPMTKCGLLRYAQLTPSMPVWFGELLKELRLLHEMSIETKTRYPDLVIDWRILQYKERQRLRDLGREVKEPQPSAVQRSDWTFEFGEYGGTVAAQGPCCTSSNAMYEIEMTCGDQMGVILGWAAQSFLMADGTHELDPGGTQVSWGIAVHTRTLAEADLRGVARRGVDQVKPVWSTMLHTNLDLPWTDLDTAILKDLRAGYNSHYKVLENQISELEAKKATALESEDYDLAKQVKVEIDSLAVQIEEQTAAAVIRRDEAADHSLRMGTILTMTLNAEKGSIALYLAGKLVGEVLHQDTNHRPLFPVIAGAPGTGVRVNLGQRSFAHPQEGFGSVLECAGHETLSDEDVINTCFDWLEPRREPIRAKGLVAREVDGVVKLFDSKSGEEILDIEKHQAGLVPIQTNGKAYISLNTLAATAKRQRAFAANSKGGTTASDSSEAIPNDCWQAAERLCEEFELPTESITREVFSTSIKRVVERANIDIVAACYRVKSLVLGWDNNE